MSNPKLGEVLAMVISAGLGYFRWTQLVPMVVTWGFVLLGLLMAVFVSFQDQSVAALVWLHRLTEPIPGLHQAVGQWFETSGAVTEDGGVRLTDEQLTPLLLQAWGLLSLLFFLLGALWHWLRGTRPGPRKRLRQKLGWAATASLAICIAFVGVLMLGPARADVTIGALVLSSTIGVFIVWVISAYCLSVSHLIGWIADIIVGSADQNDTQVARAKLIFLGPTKEAKP